jgi:hypothetical protein
MKRQLIYQVTHTRLVPYLNQEVDIVFRVRTSDEAFIKEFFPSHGFSIVPEVATDIRDAHNPPLDIDPPSYQTPITRRRRLAHSLAKILSRME